jgi:hypothetical protein
MIKGFTREFLRDNAERTHLTQRSPTWDAIPARIFDKLDCRIMHIKWLVAASLRAAPTMLAVVVAVFPLPRAGSCLEMHLPAERRTSISWFLLGKKLVLQVDCVRHDGELSSPKGAIDLWLDRMIGRHRGICFF